MKTYLVGGAVRDQLLKLPVGEKDYVVVGATGEMMLAEGFKPVGKSFPVFLHPKTKAEYALARIERKVGPGYHGFDFDVNKKVSLEEDLLRRDLTINAMAQDEHGTITDPYGGRRDLKARVLRHVSTAFVEDPVRVLRVARFAAQFAHLGFKVAPETMKLMQQMVREGELEHLVSERVLKELLRALSTPSPWVFLQVCREANALSLILPEVNALYGVPQDVSYHPEGDTGVHVEMVLQQAVALTPDPMIRFAALVHDLGKGATPKGMLPKHTGHEQRGVPLVKALCRRLNVPGDYQQLAVMATGQHGNLRLADNGDPKAVYELLERCDAFRRPDRFEQFLIACEADSRGRPGYEKKPYPRRERLLKYLKAALEVDPKSVIASLDNPSGEAIRDALVKARVAAIQTVRS